MCVGVCDSMNIHVSPSNSQFGLNELQVGLVFIGGPAMYMLLALVFGALADKYVSINSCESVI